MPPHQSSDEDRSRLPATSPDLLCFCHLRWDFVFQRPQHLMRRFASHRRVFFVEEPVVAEGPARMEFRQDGRVTVAIPRLPAADMAAPGQAVQRQRRLLDQFMAEQGIRDFVAWYYTPMSLSFSDHLCPRVTVYDCMDELSGFKGAPPQIVSREAALMARADLVLTGGRSLHEAKRSLHPRVYCFPSSVDTAHFARARSPLPDPADQAMIPGPRLGYAGVIDERLDLPLIAGLAQARPDWQIVLLGPVVKIDPATLPRAANIHYLGMKAYDDLPWYLAGWDVALLPFARNDATRFISPTKTPEYLAAGRPVVSTSITDVVRPYGAEGLARISDSVDGWVQAVAASLTTDLKAHRLLSDRRLAQGSWDQTARQMSALIAGVCRARSLAADSPVAAAAP
jgi:UDP-galactopyranose mutase